MLVQDLLSYCWVQPGDQTLEVDIRELDPSSLLARFFMDRIMLEDSLI